MTSQTAVYQNFKRVSTGMLLRCLACLICLAFAGGAQAVEEKYTPHDYSILPPAPTVSSFLDFKDFPVDYFHGVPQISYTLYNIQCGGVNVPLNLVYHSGGIRTVQKCGNTARLHDPIMVRYHNPDPLAYIQGQISPYTHCNANPANFLDQFGLIPSPYESALMCAMSYLWDKEENFDDYKKELKGFGWTISQKTTHSEVMEKIAKKIGMRYLVFEKTTNNETEYAFAFAGTCDFQDYITDFMQLSGVSVQYAFAVNFARTFSKDLGMNVELTFLGHSMGGGKAIASGLATGRDVITFNTAWVSVPTTVCNALYKECNITNYMSRTNSNLINRLSSRRDLVTFAQFSMELSLYMHLNGKIVDIPVDCTNPWEAHGINTLIKKGRFPVE